MTRRAITVAATIAAAVAVASTLRTKPAPRLVWNASESAPIGLYAVQSTRRIAVGDLVVAHPPKPLATFLAERGYLSRDTLLIKPVLAVSGQTVCRYGLVIAVDRIPMGTARERDRGGRPLPDWQGCRVVLNGEVFLMNWDEPSSLDGRYFGSLPVSTIVGRAEPLWTFEEQ
jgi:conjugative transfer signal peptidase TraF